MEINLNDIYSNSKDVSIVNILNTIGENTCTTNENLNDKDKENFVKNLKGKDNSSSKSPDNYKNNIKNKNSSALNPNINNTNFSIGNNINNNSQNNFNINNQKKKEINTPKNSHSNRMLLIDSSKDIRSKKFLINLII